MLQVLNVVGPVFVLIGIGYAAVRTGLYPASGVQGLIAFVNTFAAPCLLFRAMLEVDFAAAFDLSIIVPFYLASVVTMVVSAILARRLFSRRPGESVAVGFAAGFANTLLVGAPIIERAYGAEAMPVVYSIIGLHVPILMTGGMFYMEIARRDGGKLSAALLKGGSSSLKNPLFVGIALGVIGNAFGLQLGGIADASTAMLAAAVMPAALFGLGGALNQYRITQSLTQSSLVSGLKLMLHPFIAWLLMVPVLGVDPDIARYGVLLAAMPTGINAYIFSTYYGRSLDVATNTILITTVSSVATISFWLFVLGP